MTEKEDPISKVHRLYEAFGDVTTLWKDSHSQRVAFEIEPIDSSIVVTQQVIEEANRILMWAKNRYNLEAIIWKYDKLLIQYRREK